MNIKLDKDVRIRLSEDDVTNWKSSQQLEQSFQIGTITLQVVLHYNALAAKSRIYSEGPKLAIELSSDDFANLITNPRSDNGISIEEINIQIDRWNQDKRERHEKRIKDRPG